MKILLRIITVVLLAFALGSVVNSPAFAVVPTPLVPVPGYWFSTIDSGNTGNTTTDSVPLGPMVNATGDWCHSSAGGSVSDTLDGQWYWDYCGGAVVSAATEGLPTPPNGDKVVRWDKPLGSDQYWQKLYRQFDAANWPGATDPADNEYVNGSAPTDISARYRYNQYIDGVHTSMTGHAWSILSEFKINYVDPNGNSHQDPTWWFGCDTFDGPYSISCGITSQGGMHNATGHRVNMTTLINGWHTYEWRVYQNSKAEFYIDNVLLDTIRNSEFPITASAFPGSPKQWIFVTGQYTSNQVTNGDPDYNRIAHRSYIDSAQTLPLSQVCR